MTGTTTKIIAGVVTAGTLVFGAMYFSQPTEKPTTLLGGTTEEFWVYINPQDETDTPENIVGRAQKGDIVDIIPVSRGNGGYAQSKDFLIVKVKGLSKEDVKKLLQAYPSTEDPAIAVAERKNAIDLDAFKKANGINQTVGTFALPVEALDLPVVEKTAATLSSYQARANVFVLTQPLRKVARIIIPPVFAVTTNTYYIDPDAEAGGDGTTNGLTGANAAFQSCSIWENARDNVGDLVTNDTIEEAVADSNGASHTADATTCTLSGWTTDADNYIYLHTPTNSRHNGTWSATKYRFAMDSVSMLTISENYVRIDGLQFEMSANSGTGVGIFASSVTDNDNSIHISRSIFKKGTASGTFVLRGIYGNNGVEDFVIYNNLFYNIANSTSDSRAIFGTSVGAKIYNNTVVNSATGIRSNGIAVNNIVYGSGNTNAYIGTFAAGTDYNATDGTDSIGTGSNNLTSVADFDFNNTGDGTEDFHIGVDSDIIAAGDPAFTGDTYFSDDIDGVARGSAPWDIGADEYVAAGGGSSTCTYSGSGDWEVKQSDNCFVSTAIYVVGACKFMNDSAGVFGISSSGSVSCADVQAQAGFKINAQAGAKIYAR